MSEHLSFRPVVTSDIAVYSFPHDLDVAYVNELLTRIGGHITILRGLRIEGIMISFKKIEALDQHSLTALIDGLVLLFTKYGMPIGLGDYSHKLFPILLKLIKATPISLYKNIEIMALAIGTSRLPIFSSILVYLEEPSEARSIVSHLISRHYFVVMADSKDDMKKKLSQQESSYDKVVIESHFGNLQEQLTINFEHGIFLYNFQGSLNSHLQKTLLMDDLTERLQLGYKVLIFNLKDVFHIDVSAAYILYKAQEISAKYEAVICLVGFDKEKLHHNVFTVINKGLFWSYPNVDDIYQDSEVQEILTEQHLLIQSQGISKRIIKLIPHFVKATKQTLECLEVGGCVNESKQSSSSITKYLKPYISTHINFRGDYIGEMNFIFPRESIDIILERRQEGQEELLKEDHIDALKEFSSTIMAKLKVNLEQNRHSIAFDFPSVVDYEDQDRELAEHKYILEVFHCDDKPFYVTITDFKPEE